MICGAMLFLSSCVTVKSGRTTTVPSWVTTTPPPSSEYTYFVGSGSDTQGNIAAANENAVHSLIGDVTRYLGVKIDAQTSVETEADVKNFQTRMTESIQESSSAKVGDFSIVDRWVRSDGKQVTVFLLGRYRTSALDAEKKRLDALERERSDAVVLPERQGDELMAQGRAYAAAAKYMQAALAAASSKVDNSAIKFERNLKKAEGAVASIELTPLVDNLEGLLGHPLPGALSLEATSSAGGSRTPLPQVPFRISYPVLRSGGRSGTAEMRATTGADGRLAVKLPSPQLIGRQSVSVSLDLLPQLDPLLRLPKTERTFVAPLEQRIDSLHVVLHYSTTSQAASIPTGVLVMDLDRAGALIPDSDTASGIISALTQAGYDILPIPPNPSVLGIDDGDLVKILRNDYSDKIKRAIVGEAKISDFQQSGGNYIVKVSGSVEVADLETGKVLFSTSMIKLARASGAASAITAAFKDLGISIGDEIRNRLY